MLDTGKKAVFHIYIDISNMIIQSFISGIQRVVREGTQYLIKNQEKWGCRVHVMTWDAQKRAYHILDSEKYLLWLSNGGEISSCGSGQMVLPEQMKKGSVFFDIDAIWGNQPKRSYVYSVLRHREVKIAMLIYDIIPITHPQYFREDLITLFLGYLDTGLAYSDLIFTNSQFVADEIKDVARQINRAAPRFAVAPLGANFLVCRKSDPNIDPEVKRVAKSAPYLLLVSTIEPRKNHKVILDCFDRYLKDTDINIIFAGRKGWDVDKLLERIYQHPMYGKRIFHFEGKNNETISYLYQKAMYTVFPTYVEGFGLSAVETLIAHTPALLSDVPVMREVAGEYAQYFDPNSAKQLSKLVLEGLSHPDIYQQRKDMLKTYRPVTWEDFGKSIMEGLERLRFDES